jgi:hypothetical protein
MATTVAVVDVDVAEFFAVFIPAAGDAFVATGGAVFVYAVAGGLNACPRIRNWGAASPAYPSHSLVIFNVPRDEVHAGNAIKQRVPWTFGFSWQGARRVTSVTVLAGEGTRAVALACTRIATTGKTAGKYVISCIRAIYTEKARVRTNKQR